MEDTISLSALKALAEKKMKKKILVKIIWNDNEKITLLITPNMKINSFIYDEKEGYLFYDHEVSLSLMKSLIFSRRKISLKEKLS